MFFAFKVVLFLERKLLLLIIASQLSMFTELFLKYSIIIFFSCKYQASIGKFSQCFVMTTIQNICGPSTEI
jgi:hypothetical protein